MVKSGLENGPAPAEIRSPLVKIEAKSWSLKLKFSKKSWKVRKKTEVLDISFFRLKWRKQTLGARGVDVNKSQNYVGLQSFAYSGENMLF